MSLISNMISTIKVACNAKLLQVEIQNSKLCINILKILYQLGYIRGFVIKNKKVILVLLKYKNNKPAIKNINVISTPGRRVYIGYKTLRSELKKKDSGFFIVSSSKGIITDEESLMFNVGGEVLLKIS